MIAPPERHDLRQRLIDMVRSLEAQRDELKTQAAVLLAHADRLDDTILSATAMVLNFATTLNIIDPPNQHELPPSTVFTNETLTQFLSTGFKTVRDVADYFRLTGVNRGYNAAYDRLTAMFDHGRIIRDDRGRYGLSTVPKVSGKGFSRSPGASV